MKHILPLRSANFRVVADNSLLYLSIATILLWCALLSSRKLFAIYPVIWIVVPLTLSICLLRLTVVRFELNNIKLLQLIGSLSAVYSLIHYPLIPITGNPDVAEFLYGALLVLWAISVVSGLICYWYPSLALIAPTFLVWSKFAATAVTGLEHNEILDVQPLSDVACCLAFGIALNRVLGWATAKSKSTTSAQRMAIMQTFATITLVTAVSIHLANYFWSFLAKARLDGSPTSWLLHNDASNILLVATDDNHIFFSGFTTLEAIAYSFVHLVHIPANVFVFTIQGLAILGFLLWRRGLLLLLIAYDIMHIMILLMAGANFWPWIMLNVCIAFVVARKSFIISSRYLALYSMLFIGLASRIVNPAYLGWYDTKANNRMVFEAVDRQEKRYYVPTNFFTFYSYPMGWMGYGTPGSEQAFWIGSPNGGARALWKVVAADECNAEQLKKPDPFISGSDRPLDVDALSAFLRGYQKLVINVTNSLGFFPYNVYPHHFYDKSPLLGNDFASLDKSEIVAYLYRRESVCLTMVDGVPRRRVVSSAEVRIDVSDDQ